MKPNLPVWIAIALLSCLILIGNGELLSLYILAVVLSALGVIANLVIALGKRISHRSQSSLPKNVVRTIALCFGGMVLLPGAVFVWSASLDFWLVLATLTQLLLLCVFDAQFARSQTLEISRSMPSTVAVGKDVNVVLNVSNTSSSLVRMSVVDYVPEGLESKQEERNFVLRANSKTAYNYEVTSQARGSFEFSRVAVRVRSLIGLSSWRHILHAPATLHVYPDFAAIRSFLQLLISQKTSRIGLKSISQRGTGLEFKQLRDFRQGDQLNWIDWNASSKGRQLISKEFEAERNQTVIFLLDTGRWLRSKDGLLSHFDHALNAMMLMSYIALRQGDSVGALCFGSIQRWIQPVASVKRMAVLLNSVFDVDCGTDATDFLAAADVLQQRVRKRSLIVLLTNVRDFDQDLVKALRVIRKRHYVIVADMKEQVLTDIQKTPIESLDDAVTLAASFQYQNYIKEFQKQIAMNCHRLIDCYPRQLHIELSNAYWRAKLGGAI